MKKSLSVPKKLLLKNAAILTVTNIFVRGAGMFLRIYISVRLGAQGVGLHQLILSVYTLCSGFALSGIASAVTRLTAAELAKGSAAGARLVVRRSVMLSFSAGMMSALILLCFARPIGCGWLSDPRTVPSIRIMALILPVLSISACLRGYFVARRKIGINSAGQFCEQSARVALTVILLAGMLPKGIGYGCAALMLSDLIAETVCTAVVSAAYCRDVRKNGNNARVADASRSPGKYAPIGGGEVNRAILSIAAPITASHYLTSLLRTVESTLVPDCLTIYEGSRERALELFGMVKGMTLPLLLFPATIIVSFSSLLVPELSRSQALGRSGSVRKGVTAAMRMTFAVAVLAGGLFMLYPRELGEIFYSQPGLERIIFFLAPFVPMMYSESVAVGILYGLGEQKASLLYAVIDSAVRITLIAVLVPGTGLKGFLIVMAVSNILTPVLHLGRLGRVCGCDIDLARWLFEPGLCMAITYMTVRLARGLFSTGNLSSLLRAALGCIAAALVYISLLSVIQNDIICIVLDMLPSKRTSPRQEGKESVTARAV